MLHKLFPEINQQLLTAVLRGGTHCLSAPTTCRGLHGKCTLNVLVPTHKCAGAPHAKHWSHPAGCTLMHAHANMAHEQLCTHIHAGTQRMCVQTYLHASSFTQLQAVASTYMSACTPTCKSACRAMSAACMHKCLHFNTSVSRYAHTRVRPHAHTCQHLHTYACIPCAQALAHTCLHTAQAFT